MKYFNLETISVLAKQNNGKLLKEYLDYIGSKIKPQEFTDINSLLNEIKKKIIYQGWWMAFILISKFRKFQKNSTYYAFQRNQF